MTSETAQAGVRLRERPQSAQLTSRVRAYFFSDSKRAIQTALGLLWLLDGALQFQSFMYSKGFIAMLTQMLPGQPSWLGSTMHWAAHLAQGDLALYNTLFALTQVLIGLGLLCRRTARPALAVSFGWALVVWWFGEAFGMLFMNNANPLTGAPGAVLLYAIVGLIAWPSERPGGLLGVRGARTVWAVLWVAMSWLWLLGANSSAEATRNLINAAPSGMSWLTTVQDWAANASAGHGMVIAIVLALASIAVAVAVGLNWRARPFLVFAIVLNLAYWVLGQGLGGILTGGGTDPNAGPLFVLFAVALYTLVAFDEPSRAAVSRAEDPKRVASMRAGAAV